MSFSARGWCRFPHDPALARWVDGVRPFAVAAVTAPENASWLRNGGTWFVGVNALPNDARGAVPGGEPIAGQAVDFIRRDLGFGEFGWDRGQVSVVHPGYPQPEESESNAAFRYRLEHAAAHVDGILHEGPERRRHLRQFHDFILGIPLVDVRAGMSPLVVWEGSHELIRAAFREFFGDTPSASWPDRDVTALYRRVRRAVFDTCEPVEVLAGPGEAYLLHRLALHGIAPWQAAPETGSRMIVYFRPDTGTPASWLNAP